MGLRIGLVVGIIFVLGLIAVQIRSWRSGAMPITRRQKGLRAASAFVMISIMLMFLVGDGWIAVKYGPMGQMEYWSVACLLGLVLLILAFLDIRESTKKYRVMRRELLKEVIAPRVKKDEKQGDK
jgi:peptidoglycan/LPS O-acetylase OafA/YrhL